ncbi:MAG: hypothetical protein WB767_04005, partial [Nocardioides sp.]
AIYLGSFPRWDRQPDRYYVTGVGTTLAGDDTVLKSNSRYQLVEMGAEGMVMTPFQPTFYWARSTYMRGFPCARDGSQMLLLRGSQEPATFDVASLATEPLRTHLGLDIDGTPVQRTGPPVTVRGWSVQTFKAPQFRSAIMNIRLTKAATQAGTTAVPMLFGTDLVSDLVEPDRGLTRFCLEDEGGFLDGYDRDLTTLRTN